MFGFGKKKEEKQKSKIDKLVMGAIVGGAIGSVIGMSIAPKKGKDTREFLTQKGKDIYDKGKELNEKIHKDLHSIHPIHSSTHTVPMAPQPQKKKSLFARVKGKIFPPKLKKHPPVLEENDFRKIPHEIE